ncbi:MAG: right-handed parallel beta-helix repeat-containing protein [Candidatus Aenigmatarchaeota archaeon]
MNIPKLLLLIITISAILIIFIRFTGLFIPPAGPPTVYTVCSSGCDYDSLTACLFTINNTQNICNITGPGFWSINDSYYFISNAGEIVEIASDDVIFDCNNSILRTTLINSFVIRMKKVDNTTIRNCIFNTIDNTIDLQGNNIKIYNNSFYGDWYSLRAYDWVYNISIYDNNISTGFDPWFRVVNCTIENNNISNGLRGDFNDSIIRNNNISCVYIVINGKNTIFENHQQICESGDALQYFGGINITIRNNSFINKTTGIIINSANETNIYNNTIVTYIPTDYGGINSSGTNFNVTIINNTITGPYKTSIGILGSGNKIINNTISNTTQGIYINGSNHNISRNVIKNASQECLYTDSFTESSIISNNTFEDCGAVSGPYEAYLSSYSPLQYNGNNYTIVFYANSDIIDTVQVSEDNTNVSDIVTGENNFSLWLGTCEDGSRWTVYVEEPESMSCSDVFNLGCNGICDFEQDGYWIANGYGQNYTLNQSPQVSVIPGYTDPAWLRYSSWYVQDYYPIVLYGSSGNNITKNWIKDVNKKNNYSIYSDTNAQDRIWLNMLLSGGINITGTEPILCVNGEGNFYGEGSLGVPENDCGPASITAPTAGAYTGSITIQWTAQSSPEPVTYDVYAKNLATGEMTKLTETTSLSYLWNLSGYLGNYKAIIIPWISGSRINATWAESGILQLGQGTGGGNVTVTILTSITISLPVDTVNFGTMQLGQSDNTTDNSPPPFILQNDGSVPVNITINATQLWYSSLGSGTSSYYQFKTECNESSCVPDPDNDLVTSWTNIPINEQAILACSNLRFIDNQDTVKIHIKVTVPVDEPAGSKNSTVTFTASQA